MNTNIDVHGLRILFAEAEKLANKPHLTKSEEERASLLKLQISCVKAGASLEDVLAQEYNEIEARRGLSLTSRSRLSHEERGILREFRSTMFEARTSTVGNGPWQGLNGTTGSFVPVGFVQDVKMALKQHDPLVDPDKVTVLPTTDGKPVILPILSDVENVAVRVDEAGSTTETDPAYPGEVTLLGYTFRSPKWYASIETFQDVEALGGVLPLFKAMASDRLARGIGAVLVTGDAKITGLLPSLLALSNGVAVTASGSAGNTGGTETGATSVGTADLAKLYFSVDAAYRKSSKCGWLMSDSTLQYLAQITDKMGQPIVKWVSNAWSGNANPFILGKPVWTSPSMPSLASQATPIAFGDFSFWTTRIGAGWVQLYKEGPGAIDNGLYALGMFLRVDGKLAYNDVASGSTPPIRLLQNHS